MFFFIFQPTCQLKKKSSPLLENNKVVVILRYCRQDVQVVKNSLTVLVLGWWKGSPQRLGNSNKERDKKWIRNGLGMNEE